MYHRDVWYFPKPTIAAVNGPALAGALDLIALCDLRICCDSAVFGHPEIKLGAPPLYTPLRWIVGVGHARELCLTGSKITAETAYRMGLVSQVVEPAELLATAQAVGRSIVEAQWHALQATKQFMIRDVGFEECFAREHDQAFERLLRS